MFAFSIITSFFGFTPSASGAGVRGCEECPIPMAEWLGTWWNDDSGLKLEIKRLPGSSRHLRVTLRDIDSNQIVADGIGILPTTTDTMKMKLRRQDGVQFVTAFVIEPDNNRVHAFLPKWIGRTLNGQDVPPDLFFID